jgi:hypothetical protein
MPQLEHLVLPPATVGISDQEDREGDLIDEVIEPDLRFRLDPIRSGDLGRDAVWPDRVRVLWKT